MERGGAKAQARCSLPDLVSANSLEKARPAHTVGHVPAADGVEPTEKPADATEGPDTGKPSTKFELRVLLIDYF